MNSPSAIELVDTTLRDGEQAPGAAFSGRCKLRLAEMLAGAGIPELEVGTPAVGADEVAAIRGIVHLRLPCRVTAWCRASESDLDAAARADVNAVHISLPASQLHLRMLGKDRRWLFESIDQIVGRAVRSFDYVSVGAQDASRADLGLLVGLAQAVEAAGAHRFRLADTVGVWSPVETAAVIRAVGKAALGIRLGIHAHNDLGMATANTLSAVTSGATCADVTVLGIGERAGNAALEEVVLAMRHIHGCDLGIETGHLLPLARFVARQAGHRIADNKPIVGANAFRHESGIHVHGMLRHAQAYQPFPAAEVGATSRMVLGRHAGTGSLRHVLTQCGFHLGSSTIARWSSCLRRLAKRRVVRAILQNCEFELPT